MDLAAFRRSIAAPAPPDDMGLALRALWFDATGDGERAHEAAQAGEAATGAWMHACLHRKEGDPGNAACWYRREGRPVARVLLAEGWSEIAASLRAGRT